MGKKGQGNKVTSFPVGPNHSSAPCFLFSESHSLGTDVEPYLVCAWQGRGTRAPQGGRAPQPNPPRRNPDADGKWAHDMYRGGPARGGPAPGGGRSAFTLWVPSRSSSAPLAPLHAPSRTEPPVLSPPRPKLAACSVRRLLRDYLGRRCFFFMGLGMRVDV